MRFRIAALAVSLGLTMVAAALPGAAPAGATSATYTLTQARDYRTGLTVTVRWTACTTLKGVTSTHVITYRVNPAGVASRVTVVKQALAKVTAASGLQFHYLGTTSYIPRDAVLHYASGNQYMLDSAAQRKATGAELVVAWALPTVTNIFRGGSEAGIGSVVWGSSTASQLRILEGAAVLKRNVTLKSGFGGASVGSLLLHELGHAVGLQHVTSKAQIMYPTLGTWTPAGYASGDVAGLRKVGRPAGCFTTSPTSVPDPAAIARAAGISITY